jgi:hypothetical protein
LRAVKVRLVNWLLKNGRRGRFETLHLGNGSFIFTSGGSRDGRVDRPCCCDRGNHKENTRTRLRNRVFQRGSLCRPAGGGPAMEAAVGGHCLGRYENRRQVWQRLHPPRKAAYCWCRGLPLSKRLDRSGGGSRAQTGGCDYGERGGGFRAGWRGAGRARRDCWSRRIRGPALWAFWPIPT